MDNNYSNTLSLSIDYKKYVPITDKLCWINNFKLYTCSLDSSSFNINQLQLLGGFYPIYLNAKNYWGAGQKQYFAYDYFYASMQLQYQLMSKFYVQIGANYVDGVYPMNFWKIIYDGNYGLGGKDRRVGFMCSASYNGLLGPMTLSFAKDYDRSSNWHTFINLGFYF